MTVICFAIHYQCWESGKSFNVDFLSIRYRECKDQSRANDRASLKWAEESERSKRQYALNSILHIDTGSIFYCCTKHSDTLHLLAHPMTAAVIPEHTVCYCLTCQYRSGQLLLMLIPLKCVE